MKILVINCGSSSLKFQLIDSVHGQVLAKGLCERIGIEGSRLVYRREGAKEQTVKAPMTEHKTAVKMVLDALTAPGTGVIRELSEIDAVGHRIVHGGEKFAASVLIDNGVLSAIEECASLAPLHNPANLTGIRACMELMPETPMAAVFDTAFHQTMPMEAYLYGIPYAYYEKYRVRRYGFHGTSHKYVSRQAAKVLGERPEKLRLIVCHLGNGASVSAVQYGKSVDTSMGLTPLEGLIMGTRAGDMDPAIVEFIAHKEGKTLDEIMEILNRQSGVLGLSGGLSSDFRDLEDAFQAGQPEGERALKAFAYRVAKYIGAYTAAMNGVDGICFTAGLGENSPLIRRKICAYLGYLGVSLDEEQNRKRGEDLIISAPGCGVKVLVIPTNEELAIAEETCALVQA
ncbi:MAG: acetate kinase [Lachnospiraceae bacterium]|jgi:acetate kinase|nr:acetate kinase [Lachnospiraceae bacterium]